MKRDILIDQINDFFSAELRTKATQKDVVANGVQILGAKEVKKIALGVTCSEEFLQKAVDWGANMCIFHHGFDVRTHQSRFPLYSQKQLRLIFKNDLTIMGYHYLLDAHPEIGNNAQIIQKLDANIIDTLFDEWGFVAKLKHPTKVSELKTTMESITQPNPFHFGNLDREVQTIGVVSGAGKPYQVEIEEMLEKNVELYISGETSESAPHKMLSCGIDYLLCGHYATETFGVKALGDQLKNSQKEIEISFIKCHTPI